MDTWLVALTLSGDLARDIADGNKSLTGPLEGITATGVGDQHADLPAGKRTGKGGLLGRGQPGRQNAFCGGKQW